VVLINYGITSLDADAITAIDLRVVRVPKAGEEFTEVPIAASLARD